ncbi:GIY-YIG nuclease family protein [Microcoleus sp. FACHB-1]|nr:GIY-YIG nuclease family protein [Microcoleus sp. FACHB-1]
MEWKEWSNLPLTQRDQLPNHPGIYVITDFAEQVWYVGKSANLNNRWRGKGHHRYPQLSRTNKKKSFQIYWKPFPLEQLSELEQHYINLFNPHLKGTKVKSYIRKKAQPTAELKRIFQVLNRQTQIFPSVRSVVLGYYKELDEEEMKEYTSLVVLVNINDHDKVILGSAMRSQKKQGRHLKDFWKEYACDCGLDESMYSPVTLLVFMRDDYVYEFVCCDELRESLKKTPSKLYQVDLFNQSVTALRSPDTITELPSNTYHLPSPDSRLRLHPNDYLKYRVPMLQPVDEFLEIFV